MVSSTTSRIQYTLTSATQTVAVPFFFLAEEHLKVTRLRSGVITPLTLTTDYTTTGENGEAGGSVIFTGTGTAIDDVVTIMRNVPLTQLVDFIANSRFPSESMEASLDKLTMIAQMLSEVLGRTIRFEPGEVLDGEMALPDRLGKFVTFNATTGAMEYASVQELLDEAGASASAAEASADTATTQAGIATTKAAEAAASAASVDGPALVAAIEANETAITAETAARVAGDEASSGTRALPTMWVWDTGDYVYCRCQYDSTYDLLFKWIKAGGTNLNVQLDTVGLVTRLSQPGGTPVASVTLASSLDDTTGFLTYANGRLGGSHGFEVAVLTKTAHGITSADIGKRYQDTGGDQYAITGVVDADRFYVVQKPKSFAAEDTQGTNYYPPAATTLTGLDGLSDLTGWVAANAQAVVGTRLRSVYDRVYSFSVDGRDLIPGEITEASSLVVSEYSRVPNIRAAFAYFVATGSTATWGDSALGSAWTRRVLRTVWPWGQVTFDDTTRLGSTIVNIRFQEASPIQYARQVYSGSDNLFEWLPGTKSKALTGATINGSASPTLDFNIPQYLDTWTGSTAAWGTSDSDLSSGIPDFQIQLFAGSSSSHTGYALGHMSAIDPTFLNGQPATLAAQTPTYFKLGAVLKSYPCFLNYSTGYPASNTIGLRGFRRWTANVEQTGLDFWTYCKSGNRWLLWAAWTMKHTDGAVTITLPAWLRGCVASEVRAYRGSVAAQTTNLGEITITQSDDNGHAVILLTP